MGFLHKLFGAHDIRGRGSDVPGCAHADPFFLCDAVRLPRHAKPPFCAHPHSGAGVISLLFRAACTVRPWDKDILYVQGAEAPRRNRCARAASITSTRAPAASTTSRSTRYRAARRSAGASMSRGRPYRRTAMLVGWRSCGTMRCPRMRTRRRGPCLRPWGGRKTCQSCATKGSPCEYLSASMVA